MTLTDVTTNAIRPAMTRLGLGLTTQAHVMLLTIGLQESRFLYRRQLGNGPATGWWQFERGGGVKGVLQHPTSAPFAKLLCEGRGVTPDAPSAWAALERDDVLAAGFARLLLLTDPRPLPAVTDAQGAWDCYVRNWRPGKPHRATWDAFHAQARAAVGV